MTPDPNRLRRQTILTRHAVLDGLGLPVFCFKPGKPKVVFATRATAEACLADLDQIDNNEPRRAYLCDGTHFHLGRYHTQRKAS